jgi:hypothetical protein
VSDQTLRMSEVHDAFSRDPEAIERLRKLDESLKQEAAATSQQAAKAQERHLSEPAAPWTLDEVLAVTQAARSAGRTQGSSECADAIFGREFLHGDGIPPSLRVLPGELADEGEDP